MNNTISEVIEAVESSVDDLEYAKTEEPSGAVSVMERVAYDLESAANDLRDLAAKLDEARDILS